MSHPLLSPEHPAELLAELRALVAERTRLEVELPQHYAATAAELKKHHATAVAAAERRYREEKAATEQEFASVRRAVEAQHKGEYLAVHNEYRAVCAEIVARFEEAERSQKETLRESQWEASTVFEATKNGYVSQEKEIQQRLDETWSQVEAIHTAAVRLVERRGHRRDFPEPRPSRCVPQPDSLRRLNELAAQAQRQWLALERQPLPRLGVTVRVLGGLLCAGALIGTAIAAQMQAIAWPWVIVACIAALAVVLLNLWIVGAARRQTEDGYLALQQTWADVREMRRHLTEVVGAQAKQQRDVLTDRLNEQLRKADSSFSERLSALSLKMQTDLEAANNKYPAQLKEILACRDQHILAATTKYQGRLKELENAYHAEKERLDTEYARAAHDAKSQFEYDWQGLTDRWCGGVGRIGQTFDELGAACDGLFPELGGAEHNGWQPPQDVPPAVRVGGYRVGLKAIEGGLPRDPRLAVSHTEFAVPALLPFPHRSTLLLETGDDSAAATALIQAAMLRLLAALPPGKVRFTIVDPVGLGEPFSAFMHLADFDEKLVTNRIWTEAAHIEQRLADLTEHMENVIQLYLRNEYQTIDEYNRTAGELAEAYRVLVVANFPANFTEAAARRLTSIITSGARCGVFTILSFNSKLRMPRDFHRKDLEPHCLILDQRDGRYVWNNPAVGPLELAHEMPPEPKNVSDLVRTIGRMAKDAARVEVPFSAIAPQELWTGDAREEIDVPLGRSGARKLQHLRLGRGTAQHVLISGKTGSGKSTLLHVLVTNIALRYSPDEVELYLVDFKKGVEFKAYASAELPHARVIAIESEREFGLSVLQRLDAELKSRGDLLRKHEVQDLKSFRAAQPGTRLPRVLLMVDEFQELFVEDDRIAQEAALLLDRLVRQGRAFGIHVLLGSQTLAGAYSLPRSTIGQMAVRIALQCSESDAHLILSEDNTAARLLSRPGEAIYNDANGLFEGNHPFQVVWLSDSDRDERLHAIRRQAETLPKLPEAVVFEGQASADLRRNPALNALLTASAAPAAPPEPLVWLGSPVAIKDATKATLARQAGGNLLIVGHREEMAQGMLSAGMIGLAAQDAAGTAQFLVLNGAPPESDGGALWPRLKETFPQTVAICGVREAGVAITELAAEVKRRTEAHEENAPPRYLLVYNIARFRDLKKSDDDFGFSRYDDAGPPSPAKLFADILQEGPSVGVHAIVWCDSFQTSQRFFDRKALSQFELRVAFHMSASDSSSLIESPVAGQLGVHRAMLYHAAEAWHEKFCPYGPPPPEWLDWLGGQLAARRA